jgi:hypothetical protein
MKYRCFALLCVLTVVCLAGPYSTAAQGTSAGELEIISVRSDTTAGVDVVVALPPLLNDASSKEHKIEVVIDDQIAHPVDVAALAPPAVLVVAEVGPALEQVGTPLYSQRDDLQSQVGHLLRYLSPETPVSLITVGRVARVAVPWSARGTTIDAFISFLDAPSEAADESGSGDTSAFSAAIALALEQLRSPDPLIAERPQALFVYTADRHTLTSEVAELLRHVRTHTTPIAATIAVIGDSANGTIQGEPGNHAPLRKPAALLPDTQLLAYRAQDIDELVAIEQIFDARYQEVLRPNRYHRIRLSASQFAAGQHTLHVRLDGSIATTTFTLAERVSTQAQYIELASVLPLWLVVAALVLLVALLMAVLLLRRAAAAGSAPVRSQRKSAHSSTSSGRMQPGDLAPFATFDNRAVSETERFQEQRRSSARVLIVDGDVRRSYDLAEGVALTIGRDRNLDIVIANRFVSRSHACITLRANGAELADQASDNGTFVGEHKRRLDVGASALLHDGDTFWVGPEVKLKIEL